MRVLGIIPARGGSKSIPRKNIRPLGGKPLIQYTAEAALSSVKLERTLLTTEDKEIAAIGKDLGLWVPFLRPTMLAQDETPTLPVLLHVVDWLNQEHEEFDAFCLLQPTVPFRTSKQIDEAIELLENSESDSVVSVTPVPHHYHPMWQFQVDSLGMLKLWNDDPTSAILIQRQALSKTYARNGSLYVMRRQSLVEQQSLYGKSCLAYIQYEQPVINIDTEDDWKLAENFLRISYK
ncbi:MAG: acylneuraminate cytidylyltransferase family protein [Chitinophagaceae bacterium]